MLQIIQVGRCRRGWDSERMSSYHGLLLCLPLDLGSRLFYHTEV